MLLIQLAWGQADKSRDSTAVKVTIPEAVIKAFFKLAPVSDNIHWKKSDSAPSSYQVDFYHSGLPCNAEFDSVGRTSGYQIEVRIDTLPLAARKAVLRRISHQWKKQPIAVIRVIAEADCKAGHCLPMRWFITTYSSQEEAIEDARKGHFWVSKTGHISEPVFR